LISRARLGAGDAGPGLGLRPWRSFAGVCLGLATATKWNAAFFLVAFSLLSVLWDRGARRAVGVQRPSLATLRRDVGPAFLALPATMVVTFLASYTGWFLDTGHGGGWDRYWAATNPPHGFAGVPFGRTLTAWVPNPLRSLWFDVHQQYQVSVNITTPHQYMSNPWSWLVVGRPVVFYVGAPGCTAQNGCSEVSALGNPLLWWFATVSIFYLLWAWIARRDWRAAAILCGIAAGLLPWMHYAQRTIFSFYAVAFAPFTALAATMAVGAILGRADALPKRRAWGAAVSGTVVVSIAGSFIYFYPIYTGQPMSYPDWAGHMWLPSWI
jgi:dolichyl-phosphate-mannose-protein mannosyltransferase